MKVVILCGGLGTRFKEETEVRPKPMIEIGGQPILWHIMNIYASQGFNEFVLALGYKQDYIKKFFVDFCSLSGDLTVDLGSGKTTLQRRESPNWKVHLIDTGLNTNTAGRIHHLKSWVGSETFMMTYGDGVGDIDLHSLIDHHKKCSLKATVTAVRPPARFGGIEFDNDRVAAFTEKPQSGEGWINGGFFVLESTVFDYIQGDESWEKGPLERIAKDGQLAAYQHFGFWQAMDTLREKQLLEGLWESGNAPWKMK